MRTAARIASSFCIALLLFCAVTTANPEILAAHNAYRDDVDVDPLTYSDTLAASAQAWAEHDAEIGSLVHSDPGGSYGENIARGTAGSLTWTEVVQLWGSEESYFIYGPFGDGSSTTGHWYDVGHYTQIVWSTTLECGCGKATNSTENADYFVCQYSPPGNYWGLYPYPVAPAAGFTGTPVFGTAPLTVTFTDTSTGTPASWSWDFGDGDSTNATAQNPVHTFAVPGTYTVNLTATNAQGSDSEEKEAYITVSDEPVLLSKVGVFRPSTQRFYLDTSGDGKWGLGDSQYAFGLGGDLPVAGDWNNDDIIKIGVFRPSKQTFYLDTSGDGQWGAWDSQYAFGRTGDLPVAGDWTNDDTTEIGVFRPSTQRFYLDTSGDGKWGLGDTIYAFGLTGDLPVAGDWNDDGIDEIGVFRPSTQRFYLDATGDGRWGSGDSVIAFGRTGDLPVAGDWNNDDTDEIGVFRPSTQRFYLDTTGDGRWGLGDSQYAFGRAEDLPVAGMWQ